MEDMKTTKGIVEGFEEYLIEINKHPGLDTSDYLELKHYFPGILDIVYNVSEMDIEYALSPKPAVAYLKSKKFDADKLDKLEVKIRDLCLFLKSYLVEKGIEWMR